MARKLTYEALMKLKRGSVSDPTTPGLDFRAVSWTSRGQKRHAVVGRFRYIHPVTERQEQVSLGRVPTPDELPPSAFSEAFMIENSGPVAYTDLILEPFRWKAREYRLKVRQGLDPRSKSGPDGLTVADALALQLDHCKTAERRPKTVRLYKQIHRHLADWERVNLRKLTPTMVREKHQRVGHQSGKSMANTMLRVLIAAWNLARVEDPSLGEFPGRGITRFKEAKKATGLPLDALPEWFRALESVPKPRRSLYLLGLLTGLRRNDLCSIERENVKGSVVTIPAPKSGRPFGLPLSKCARSTVERQLSSHNNKWLWPSENGYLKTIDPKPGEFPFKWTPHDLRRAYISAATAAGVHPYVLKVLVNHSTGNGGDVTLGYVHLDAATLLAAQEKVADFLRGFGLKC